jgi:transcriptional regulator with XRE-family HTH domain
VAKGRGGGQTPERVVELIKNAVAKKSQSAVARESGLALLTVKRYLKGVGEPSIETLQKLSNYFGVSVPWLRGEDPQIFDEARGNIDLALLEKIVKTVEDFLKEDGTFDMHREKKIELIKLLYEKYSKKNVDIKINEPLLKAL